MMIRNMYQKEKDMKDISAIDKFTNNYFVFCKGGQSKFKRKEQAIKHVMQKELFFVARLYETVGVDENGFDVLKCIYFTGCGLKLQEI